MANVAAPMASGRIQIVGRFPASTASTSIIPDAIIGNRKIGPGPKLVYSRLLTYAAMNEPATNNRIASDLAVSPRSVRNYVAALKAAGFVEVLLHSGKPSSYKLATVQ